MLTRGTCLTFGLAVLLLSAAGLEAQMARLHGDKSNLTSGIHAGNLFRVGFYNDGSLGYKYYASGEALGEWPTNSGHIYLRDAQILLGAQVLDRDGELKYIISTSVAPDPGSSTHDSVPYRDYWKFLPLPGFFNPAENRVAMSHRSSSWPAFWPDKYDDPQDPGWPAAWNGYFGKNRFNADEESYFVADDYQNREFNFYPDSTDTLRRGLGMRMYGRGFQWSSNLFQDILFKLYDFENIGTYNHDKMVFGFQVENSMGQSLTGGDEQDEAGGFNKKMDIAFQYDYDDIGAGGWSPVGFMGFGLLETPGNPYDGIDNDGDAVNGSGNLLDKTLFAPRMVVGGDPVILIDYESFQRTSAPFPQDSLVIRYRDLVYTIKPGDVLEEIPHNLVDDNLNGLIDENNGIVLRSGADQTIIYLNLDLKYVDYLSGFGADNPLIDERRDDGFDNDGDWSAAEDDVGQDGLVNSGDLGEGDGLPTVGEPHFEATDIDESDMVGLTSYTLYFWEEIPLYEDETLWRNLQPGSFNKLKQNLNTEMLFGAGYFGMRPRQHQRISLAIMCAFDLPGLLNLTANASFAFGNNYLISQTPPVPQLTATAGNNQVRLMWDAQAEQAVDPVTGIDFEGYNVYRSGRPDFQDMALIARFDLVNDYSGYSPLLVGGKRFYLGDNTGITHEYVDDTARNGHDYYYAVTAFDHGAPELGIAPGESRILLDRADQDYCPNIVMCMPRDPRTSGASQARRLTGQASGGVCLTVFDRDAIKLGHSYRLTFGKAVRNDDYNWEYWETSGFSLADMTDRRLLFSGMPLTDSTGMPISYLVDGFRIDFNNAEVFTVNKLLSGWSDSSIYPFDFKVFHYSRTAGYPESADYQIEFGEVGIDTSIEMKISAVQTLPPTPVNFRVKNLATGSFVNFGFWERDFVPGKEGQFTAFTDRRRADEIIFVDEAGKVTWGFSLFGDSEPSHRNPRAGDFVKIVLHKPFADTDVFAMTMPDDFTDVETKPVEAPLSFQLLPNFPNPFNPTTTISFSIPNPAHVRLEIYNALGQKVRMLVDEPRGPASYTLTWDGLNDLGFQAAAGVYFYRLQASAATETRTDVRKMLLLR